jgi:hypothetical protein
MIPNNVTEQLLNRLVTAARRRHEQGIEVVPGMNFEDFIKAVQRVGQLTVDLASEGVNLHHTGMALDYYARAIAYMMELGC